MNLDRMMVVLLLFLAQAEAHVGKDTSFGTNRRGPWQTFDGRQRAARATRSQAHGEVPMPRTEKPAKRAALCFYGLTRSLRYVYFSILLNVVQPLLDLNIAVDKYLHTYNLSEISNRRSKEKNTALDLEEYKLLEPYQGLLVTNQSEFLRTFDFSSMLFDNHDTYRDGFQSMTNLACQLHSLRLVTMLWQRSGLTYDLVIYSRPDVLYVKPVDFSSVLQKLSQNDRRKTWVIPQFGNIRGRMNDRFAMGLPEPMATWGSRANYVQEYVNLSLIHI